MLNCGKVIRDGILYRVSLFILILMTEIVFWIRYALVDQPTPQFARPNSPPTSRSDRSVRHGRRPWPPVHARRSIPLQTSLWPGEPFLHPPRPSARALRTRVRMDSPLRRGRSDTPGPRRLHGIGRRLRDPSERGRVLVLRTTSMRPFSSPVHPQSGRAR